MLTLTLYLKFTWQLLRINFFENMVKLSITINAVLNDLELFTATLDFSDPIKKVYDIFDNNHTLPGIIIMKGDSFFCLLSKARFHETMNKQFMFELLYKKSIEYFFEGEVFEKDLILNYDTPIPQAATEALNRGENKYDPVVVCTNENDYKILDFNHLLLANSQIQEMTAKLVLDQKHELELLNATKDKFFSILSHDLKNPIGSIMELSKALHENILEFSKEESKELVSMIYDGGEKTYELLLELLEWSRSQRGLIEYNLSKIDLSKLIKENMELAKATANKNYINLVAEFAKDSVAYGDKNSITTVIRNLLSNALKFTPESGMIKLSTKHSENFDKLIVSIADTGIGLPKEDLPKLFRVDVKNTEIGVSAKGKGTGLGLILCKDFITNNNGEIWVESELGKGTTFHFSLNRMI